MGYRIPEQFGDDPFMEAVHLTLVNEIKAALKEPLMKEAEGIVDAAVDRATAALEIKVRAFMSDYSLKNTLEIIVKKTEKSTETAI